MELIAENKSFAIIIGLMKLVKTTDNQECTQERNLEFLGNTGGWAKIRNSCVDLQINTTHISSMLTEPEICTAI